MNRYFFFFFFFKDTATTEIYTRKNRRQRQMCIRDRRHAGHFQRLRRAQGSHPGGFLAVSYTHLRAHETPEHLVRRLLLEKKKDQQIERKQKKKKPHSGSTKNTRTTNQ